MHLSNQTLSYVYVIFQIRITPRNSIVLLFALKQSLAYVKRQAANVKRQM